MAVKRGRRGLQEEDRLAEIARLGLLLRELREAQGLSYDDVAAATHVRPHFLRAIEAGALEEIGAPIYIRGFVKTYCEYLLAMDLWRKFEVVLPQPEGLPAVGGCVRESLDINHPTPIFRRSSMIWVYILLLLAVLGAAYLLWSQPRDPGRGAGGFFLRTPPQSAEGPASGDAAVSGDIALPVEPVPANAPSADVRSADGGRTGAGASSPASADLSWMDGAAPQGGSPAGGSRN